MNGALQRLRAEISSDWEAFAQRADELAGIDLDNVEAAGFSQAALALHHAYSAVESILERVARQVEGSVPIGSDWHKSLLDAAALELEGIRPPLLGRDTVRALHELRAFRHFLRHAYSVELEPAELRRHQATVKKMRQILAGEIQAILKWLEEAGQN